MKPMKVATKRTLIIVTPIIAVLLITVLALSLIRVNPINPFLGEYEIAVVNRPLFPQNEERANEIKEVLEKSTDFSVMRALLEFNTDFSIKAVEEEKNGELKQVNYTAEEFLNLKPSNSQYMLRLKYKEALTNEKFKDENGNLIKFTELIIVIDSPNGDIQDIKLYPYMEINLDNNFYDLEEFNERGEIYFKYYYVYEFKAKLYTNTLYEHIEDLGFTHSTSSANEA